MKVLIIFFIVASFGSKNTTNDGTNDACKSNDVVIEFEDSEERTENNTMEAPVKIRSPAQRNQVLTLEQILTKQKCAWILEYLGTDQLALFNANTYFRDLMLEIYKEQIRCVSCEATIYSFDQILCLSAIDIRFQKAIREEVNENKLIFTEFYDHVKKVAQKIPNCDDYVYEYADILYWKVQDVKDTWRTCQCRPDFPDDKHGCRIFPGPIVEYAKLATRRMEIIGDALENVNKYNLTRQKPETLIENSFLVRLGLLFLLSAYIPFLLLPFDSRWGKQLHWMLALFSLMYNLSVVLCRYTGTRGFFAQIPKRMLCLYKIFGVATGIFNVCGAFEYRSFVTYVLTAIFIGSFYILPLIIILLRAACRHYISKPRPPSEICDAKKNIQKIQRSFFLDV